MWPVARRLLFLADAERAHDLTRAQIERVQELPPLLGAVQTLFGDRVPELPVRRWNLTFRNPLGIAAGFDKNASMIPFLSALGFGFIEVGTVTLHPQAGNTLPRLFRAPTSRALVNRLGFNNDGARAVAARLRALRESANDLPPIFVNIGRNRNVANEDAAESYAQTYRLLAPMADGVVVNVSSPNTPGLRDLQQAETLRELLVSLRAVRDGLELRETGENPILVKISPDMAEEDLVATAEVCLEYAEGMIATNTTISRPPGWDLPEAGGLSGAPLRDRSNAVLRRLRDRVGSEYPLVGVGGVIDGDDARLKLDSGADLVQGYTGFVYGGPGWAGSVVRRLAAWRDMEAR